MVLIFPKLLVSLLRFLFFSSKFLFNISSSLTYFLSFSNLCVLVRISEAVSSMDESFYYQVSYLFIFFNSFLLIYVDLQMLRN